MVKAKHAPPPDTPRRRSARLLKQENPPEDEDQLDTAPDHTAAAAVDINEDIDTAEELAVSVFKNMKRMLVDQPVITEKSVEQSEILPLEVASKDRSHLNKKQQTHNRKLDQLACSLQPNLKETPYFSYVQGDIVKSHLKRSGRFEDEDSDLLSRSVLKNDFELQTKAPPMHVSKIQRRKLKKMERDWSAGSDWFDLPAPVVTPELKNDLRLLKMRGALDPSRHYKKNDSKELPKYFQVGRIVEGTGEFYSARIPRKARKSTIVEELLEDDKFRRYRKKKYSQLQKEFQSGTKRYRNMKFNKKFKKKTFRNFY